MQAQWSWAWEAAACILGDGNRTSLVVPLRHSGERKKPHQRAREGVGLSFSKARGWGHPLRRLETEGSLLLMTRWERVDSPTLEKERMSAHDAQMGRNASHT